MRAAEFRKRPAGDRVVNGLEKYLGQRAKPWGLKRFVRRRKGPRF